MVMLAALSEWMLPVKAIFAHPAFLSTDVSVTT
jgi:hypothetical protein